MDERGTINEATASWWTTVVSSYETQPDFLAAMERAGYRLSDDTVRRWCAGTAQAPFWAAAVASKLTGFALDEVIDLGDARLLSEGERTQMVLRRAQAMLDAEARRLRRGRRSARAAG